jgi:hypothetical protein
VNDGPPGATPKLQRTYINPQNGQPLGPLNVEYLFLVNGLDDAPSDGFIDNYWYVTNNNLNAITDAPYEYENETWQGVLSSLPTALNNFGQVTAGPGVNLVYSISRRPVPSSRGRELQLPSNVVIDLTTSFSTNPAITPTLERSRLPQQAINMYTGSVDILVYPTGQVVPTMNYSTPASVGLNGSFFHFWLAERSDVVGIKTDPVTGNPIQVVSGQNVFLPIGNIQQASGQAATTFLGPRLKGECRLVTVFSRNGQVATNDNVLFDNPSNPQNPPNYNASLPFLQAQQGIAGGH